MRNEFSTTLTRMLAVCDKSPWQVAYLGDVDSAYLRRLISGEKNNPSPVTLRRIWTGLIFDPRIVEAHPDIVHGLYTLSEASVMSAGDLTLTGD